jgi:hypothetical protein
MRVAIGTIKRTFDRKPVYERKSGDVYMKLDNQFHAKVILNDSGSCWLLDGPLEELDPKEMVRVLQ